MSTRLFTGNLGEIIKMAQTAIWCRNLEKKFKISGHFEIMTPFWSEKRSATHILDPKANFVTKM
jgi:hypothetical protein